MANGIPLRRPGPRWLLAAVAVAVLAALIAVPLIVTSARHRAAALALYRSQLLTVTKRFATEELFLGMRPAHSGTGPLRVSVGAGGVTSMPVKPRAGGGQLKQIAYSITVTSPYASTRVAVWNIEEIGPPGAIRNLIDKQSWCVLSSTLLGPGPARTNLDLGGGRSLAWCRSAWLASGPLTEDLDPRLGLAGISPS